MRIYLPFLSLSVLVSVNQVEGVGWYVLSMIRFGIPGWAKESEMRVWKGCVGSGHLVLAGDGD